MNNVEALKSLYVALGGAAEDVADCTLSVEVLNAIAEMYDGESDAVLNPEAIENIAAVAGDIGGKVSGTKTITSNGTHDVTAYESAYVNVPNPSTGTKTITANGTHDVTNYASAKVNVPTPSLGSIQILFNATVESGKSVYCKNSLEISDGMVKSASTTLNETGKTYTVYGTKQYADRSGGNAVIQIQELNRSVSALDFSITNGTMTKLYENYTGQMYVTYIQITAGAGGTNIPKLTISDAVAEA